MYSSRRKSMKTRSVLWAAVGVLVFSFLLGGCAQPDRQLAYGTWTNQKGHYQKMILTPDGIVQNFYLLSDTSPVERAQVQIVKAWSDADGNVWFNTEGTIIEGPNKNSAPRVQTLEKISKSGSFLEVMVRGVTAFNPQGFPTKIDPSDPYLYMSFDRSSK
jgi:hypothetical protein